MFLFRSVRKHLRLLFVVWLSVECACLLAFMPVSRFAIVVLIRAVLSGRYAWLVPLALLWLALGIAINVMLKSLNWRWLEWSPFKVKGNLMLLPIEWPWLWVPYTALLAACIPILAFLEEFIFRFGTTNWIRGLLWGSLAFGLLHLVSCVSIRMTLYITPVGVFLVELYMRYGLLAVFVVHAVYNLAALFLLVFDQHLKAPLSIKFPIMRRWTNQLNRI